jgi:hypothetical protein
MIHGNDVLLRLVASGCDVVVPFANKTVRDKYAVLTHEAAIEGDGLRSAITERVGATGGFTTPLTIDTAPVILGAMFGDVKTSFFVSETRNLYQSNINLCAADASKRFALIEQFGNTTKEYADCVCSGFELRIHRGEAVKAHFDIDSGSKSREQRTENKENGEQGAGNGEQGNKNFGERFKEDGVAYFADGKFWYNIYAAVLSVNKVGGCKTVLTLSRVLGNEDLPEHIDLIDISVRLFRDKYEERRYGTFHVTLFDLCLITDGTSVNTADAVIGALRYAVSGSVNAAVYEER